MEEHQKMSISIPKKDYEWLRGKSFETGISMNAFIKLSISQYIRKGKIEDKKGKKNI